MFKKKFFKKYRLLRDREVADKSARLKKQGDIEKYLLSKYQLADIRNRHFLTLLHLAFFLAGVITLVLFFYRQVNALSQTGGAITLVLGVLIFRFIKKYGIRKPDKSGDLNLAKKEVNQP